MMRLDDPRLAQELTKLVDQRVAYALQQRTPQTRYGVVDAVDAANRKVAVRLGASLDASPGFAYSSRMAPAVGDFVRVIYHGADRYVDEAMTGRAAEAARIGRSVASNASQTIATAAATRLVHQVATWTDDGTTTYTVGSMQVGRAGLYLVTAHVEYASNATGPWRIIGIGRNAGGHPTTWGGFGTPSSNTYAVSYGTPNPGSIRHHAAWVVPLAVGDWLGSFGYQDSGGNLAATNAELTIVRIGP